MLLGESGTYDDLMKKYKNITGSYSRTNAPNNNTNNAIRQLQQQFTMKLKNIKERVKQRNPVAVEQHIKRIENARSRSSSPVASRPVVSSPVASSPVKQNFTRSRNSKTPAQLHKTLVPSGQKTLIGKSGGKRFRHTIKKK